MTGPLNGIRIIEMAGIGPGPFAAMMLADHGAEVIRVERPGAADTPADPLLRSRTSITLDLKQPDGIAALKALCRTADGLIEGYRPGVMERLGLGPDVLLGENPALVYGRMTGWGQDGPWSQAAGHDINYIALSGVLGAVGRAGDRPLPPLNLAGDFGGGGMMLAFGMVSALLHAKGGGKGQKGGGQVVDCAMTEGSALLMSMIWGFRGDGSWREERGVNLLDTGAPYYDVYETADGQYVALGAIEPQFYALFRARAGLADDPFFDVQDDPALWPGQRERLTTLFRTRTRDDWCAAMGVGDACFTPVLSMTEALAHPHNRERQAFLTLNGTDQPAPAPRYSATPCARPRAPVAPGTDTGAVLAQLKDA